MRASLKRIRVNLVQRNFARSASFRFRWCCGGGSVGSWKQRIKAFAQGTALRIGGGYIHSSFSFFIGVTPFRLEDVLST
jgi:hypothetical protein